MRIQGKSHRFLLTLSIDVDKLIRSHERVAQALPRTQSTFLWVHRFPSGRRLHMPDKVYSTFHLAITGNASKNQQVRLPQATLIVEFRVGKQTCSHSSSLFEHQRSVHHEK